MSPLLRGILIAAIAIGIGSAVGIGLKVAIEHLSLRHSRIKMAPLKPDPKNPFVSLQRAYQATRDPHIKKEIERRAVLASHHPHYPCNYIIGIGKCTCYGHITDTAKAWARGEGPYPFEGYEFPVPKDRVAKGAEGDAKSFGKDIDFFFEDKLNRPRRIRGDFWDRVNYEVVPDNRDYDWNPQMDNYVVAPQHVYQNDVMQRMNREMQEDRYRRMRNQVNEVMWRDIRWAFEEARRDVDRG